jgi:tetratricopeptide (TPR) repeat protein
MLSEALFLESQARMQAGQLELAAELIDEAVEVGQRGNSPHLWGRYSFEGDLAVLRGRPREALEHYSVALEHAQEHHDHIQVYMDLCGLAEALVMSQSPIQALEVCGIAEAQITDAGAPPGSTFVGEDFQRQAQERVGARAAAEARKRGRQVEVGYRVTRACELARVALREVPRPRLEPASGP